jgi:hypothetical protein
MNYDICAENKAQDILSQISTRRTFIVLTGPVPSNVLYVSFLLLLLEKVGI